MQEKVKMIATARRRQYALELLVDRVEEVVATWPLDASIAHVEAVFQEVSKRIITEPDANYIVLFNTLLKGRMI